jgi:hypothetical protein
VGLENAAERAGEQVAFAAVILSPAFEHGFDLGLCVEDSVADELAG